MPIFLYTNVQAGGNEPIRELSHAVLNLIRRAENLLLQRAPMPWELWTSGFVRHMLTHSLPRTLHILQHMSQLVQQELKSEWGPFRSDYE